MVYYFLNEVVFVYIKKAKKKTTKRIVVPYRTLMLY